MQSQRPLQLLVLVPSESQTSSLLQHLRHRIPLLIEIPLLHLLHLLALSVAQAQEVTRHPLHGPVSSHLTYPKRVTLLTKRVPLHLTLFDERPPTFPSRKHLILLRPTPSRPIQLLRLHLLRHLQNQQTSLPPPHHLHDSLQLSIRYLTKNAHRQGDHIWR